MADSSKNGTYKVIGTRPIRHDGTEKVIGKAIYGGDTRLPGMLHGQVLRSPHAHARIKSIDTSEAEALAGVRAVVTSEDLPSTNPNDMVDLGEGMTKLKFLRDNVLASDKALYRGHAIVGVAAINQQTADEALSLIKVDYEILPPVVGVRDAMREDAPLLHDDLTTEELGEDTGKHSNIAAILSHKLGDIEKGFAEADIVVEREFDTATVHQGYIEPHNGTAVWNPDGQITVWTSTQGAFVVQKQTAAVLDQPISKIKVVPQEIGGGFGGKIPLYLEPVAALLSRKTQCPVKLLMTRAGCFEGTGPTPGTYIRLKLGASNSGKLVAADGFMAFEAGAYPGSPVFCGLMCIFSCYEIPNAEVVGYDVVVNKPKTAPYRAPGSTQVAFAFETMLNEIAEKLEMDQFDIRLLNAAKEGTRRVDGLVYPPIGCEETISAGKNHDHYKTPLKGPYRGRGVATGFWFNIGFKSSVTANVNEDGTVNLMEGSTDIGGSRTSIAMQFAEVLKISAEDIIPRVGDTGEVGYTDVTGGSRTTYATGWAAHDAAQDVKAQMIERAANHWETPADNVEFDDGVYRNKSDSSKSLNFKELAAIISESDSPVIGRASVNLGFGVGGSFATNIVDVEVDPETGKVKILRFTVIQDAGKAIHPSYVEGQMQGGSVQGIGWALNEEYFYNKEGVMENSTFLDYRIPTALDLPLIDTVIVEKNNPDHPFGVRGIGESSIVPPPAAIANAIYNAIGVRFRELPIRPDRIVAAITLKEGSKSEEAVAG
ncbi:MAG: 4-hydroxybenzoyl-CoA reductase subunit alpha [Candidatus Moanabacter tarae]|uniref:4-hydroxybenzoyl-CoA reductase subunit alpha n=1 Tax=Candidatus Moanibacter tarae TaxID=2200854 RepID=A0A2Z4AFF4_9BACT|nr:MAG: 4-hydroxybenzoyl-CoA reductase subunit alpha [Candidatus Moanabacter tarae]|tara:strand:- start:6761 stop:9064 length:2304 start_codon:yes stop_codon:yes gene_type:complete